MGLEQFSPAQLYEFWQLGDVNLDGKINDRDLDMITDFFGSYHPSVDLNVDTIIDEADLQIAAANYGLNIYGYFGVFNLDVLKNALIGIAVFAAGAGLVYWFVKTKKT